MRDWDDAASKHVIFKTEDDMTQACSLLGLNDVWAVSGRDDLRQTDKSYFVTIWEKSVVSGPQIFA